ADSQNQSTTLLERDISRTGNEIIRKPMCHRGQRTHGTRNHNHARGDITAAGQRRADITKAIGMVGQLVELMTRLPKLLAKRQNARRRHHQVRFDIRLLTQELQHADCVLQSGGACHADHQPPGRRRGLLRHATAPAPLSTSTSSSLSYISDMMSAPPMNSPPTYS